MVLLCTRSLWKCFSVHNNLIIIFRQSKRFRAEVKVKYHHDDVPTKRTEQLGCSGDHEDGVEVQDELSNALAASDVEHLDDEHESKTSYTTSHYRRMQRAEDAWSKLREGFVATTLQNQGSFFGENCSFCDSEVGVCRCLDCGPTINLCESCAVSKHSKYNIFHRVEILKVG